MSVDTEPPPVPSSGAHVDSSDSSSGVGGGGGAPHHPVVAEDFKQRVQEAVHEAPSVHLTEESAPSDTQAESQTETESGSLEPKLETGSDVMELRPEPVPTSEHKNKLEEEEEGKGCVYRSYKSMYKLEHSKRDLTDIDTLGKSRARGDVNRGRSPRSINVSEGE